PAVLQDSSGRLVQRPGRGRRLSDQQLFGLAAGLSVGDCPSSIWPDPKRPALDAFQPPSAGRRACGAEWRLRRAVAVLPAHPEAPRTLSVDRDRPTRGVPPPARPAPHLAQEDPAVGEGAAPAAAGQEAGWRLRTL